ncbi:unnamed protein product, partial [Allacma fusca]
MAAERCDYCHLTVVPFNEENTTYISQCQHLYHHRCLAAMMRGRTERNKRNQTVTPCAHPRCVKKLSMGDVAQVRRSPSSSSNPKLEDYETRKREDEMAIFKHRMALLAVENKEIKARYKLVLQHRGDVAEPYQERNPATLYKPRSNLTNDFVPVNGNYFPAPRNPTYFPIRTASTFHVEYTTDGRPFMVQSSIFPPAPIITDIDNRSRTISFRNQHTGNPTFDLRNHINHRRSGAMTTNNSATYNQPNVHRSSSEPRFPKKGPSILKHTQAEERSLPLEQLKGTSANKASHHRRYWLRWHTSSNEIQPFYPLNSYPKYFTAAGYEHEPKIYRSVYFTFDILMVGDGHVEALARILEINRPFAGILDRDLYRRDLLLEDLMEYLDSWTILPRRIMISIGHANILQRTPEEEFKETLRLLGSVLNKLKVREAIIVPLIPHPSFDRATFHRIRAALDRHWIENFNGLVIRIDDHFSELHSRQAHFDEMGPYYDNSEYTPIFGTLKSRFIP